ERVAVVIAIGGRAAIAAEIGRDRAKAERGEARELMPPAVRQLRPAVDEDDRRTARAAAGQIARRVTAARDRVLGDRKSGRAHVGKPKSDVIRAWPSIAAISSSLGRRWKRPAAS